MDESYIIIALLGQNIRKRNIRNDHKETLRRNGFQKTDTKMSIRFAYALLNGENIISPKVPVKRNI